MENLTPKEISKSVKQQQTTAKSSVKHCQEGKLPCSGVTKDQMEAFEGRMKKIAKRI